jgi:hypothetical protein
VIWPGLVAVAMPKAYWVAAHRLSERIFKTCVLGRAERRCLRRRGGCSLPTLSIASHARLLALTLVRIRPVTLSSSFASAHATPPVPARGTRPIGSELSDQLDHAAVRASPYARYLSRHGLLWLAIGLPSLAVLVASPWVGPLPRQPRATCAAAAVIARFGRSNGRKVSHFFRPTALGADAHTWRKPWFRARLAPRAQNEVNGGK